MWSAPTNRLDNVVAETAGVTRSQARALIMEGRVRINGEIASKPGQNVREGSSVEVERPRRFVSRGGEKLEHALDAFGIEVTGFVALDVGASTGGFTDCLLQRGAQSVVAVDVGYGQLDWKLRNDPRVVVMERQNFRHLADDAFPDKFDLVVIDASFISLHVILARAIGYLRPGGRIVALVKPQFEAGKDRISRGGVVRDPALHRAILAEARGAAERVGFKVAQLVASPLVGPAGNREFLFELRLDGSSIDDARIAETVGEGVGE
jgi:23S rRNA (cytidine1920-2'-O)/16S rRNA (cytidine1409-2'-O)-methyltransferase